MYETQTHLLLDSTNMKLLRLKLEKATSPVFCVFFISPKFNSMS